MIFPEAKRGRKGTRARRLLLVAALAVVVWSLLAWAAAHALVVRAELTHADALVVLSGSGVYLERAGSAAQLWKEGRADKIILTNDSQHGGWSEAKQRNPSFVERASEELERAGVAADKIEVLPEAVTSTHDEALLLRRYATTHGLRSILVVTSAYHSRRALWTLRRVFQGSGIEVGLTAVAPGQQSPPPATWWWHALGWRTVALEYIKLGYYWLSYR
ncbi:MAG TPA: YdcF family protein [Pyrinomonadaceae bacterium]|nr:YdcF family protein [Pyrinomonadaceae bacterium]